MVFMMYFLFWCIFRTRAVRKRVGTSPIILLYLKEVWLQDELAAAPKSAFKATNVRFCLVGRQVLRNPAKLGAGLRQKSQLCKTQKIKIWHDFGEVAG
jgi:hypothetical protein